MQDLHTPEGQRITRAVTRRRAMHNYEGSSATPSPLITENDGSSDSPLSGIGTLPGSGAESTSNSCYPDPPTLTPMGSPGSGTSKSCTPEDTSTGCILSSVDDLGPPSERSYNGHASAGPTLWSESEDSDHSDSDDDHLLTDALTVIIPHYIASRYGNKHKIYSCNTIYPSYIHMVIRCHR